MDEYYKKQLSDYQPADDQWNVPSEELWDKALPHFPQPKKKKRFVFLLFPVGILFLALAIYFSQQDIESTSRFISDSSIRTTENTSDINTTSIPRSKTKVIHDSEIGNLDLNHKPISTHNAHNQSKNSESDIEHNSRKIKVIINKSLVERKNQFDFNKSDVTSYVKTNQATTSKFLETKELSFSDNYILSSASTINRQDKSLMLMKPLPIESLGIKELKTNDIVSNQVFLKIPSVSIIDQKAIFPKNEIGIGSSLHLLSLLGELENDANDEWPDEELFFNTYKNKNLNLHYNYYLNKKWFVSSGLYYHNINFELKGCTFDVLSQSSIDGFVESNLDNRLIDGPTSNRQSNDFQIELINGETVSAGDTLKVHLDVSLSLNTIQVPIAINKTWRIKRTELFTGIGGTIDLQSWKQRAADIELYRENNLITSPYSEGEEAPEYAIAYNIMFQTGINYNITKKFKFGLAARLFLPELVPTGFEARFLYRL